LFIIRDERGFVHDLGVVLFELVDRGVGVQCLQYRQVVVIGQLGGE